MFKLFFSSISLMLIAGFILGAVLWPYTINTWLLYVGKDPAVVWWQGGLLGFVPVIGQLSVPAAVVTWLVMLFIA